ncbi:MAG: glycoside hydrolase family 9 protein, partial [Bacteroidota bacterium]
EKDLRGGWYDAGDYNKYTPWTSSYVIEMLRAYEENPDVWADNYCLPYSSNGIPDLIDEAKWGLDYLMRLQETDGSMISVVSLDHSSPPSSADGQSLYGAANTISALAGAAAFAHGARVFSSLGMADYSNQLLESATKAWDWADANPSVIWRNNDAAFNSVGIGAGQQETDDYGRLAYKFRAAVYLFEATEQTKYRDFIDANYQQIHLVLWNFAFPFEQENQEAILYYSSLPEATPSVSQAIKTAYRNAMESDENFGALNSERDPYLAYLKDYVWGSNGTKSRKGLMFADYVRHEVNSGRNAEAMRAAERYVHYIHGLNPLNFCYLSNMLDYGADQGVTQFYHAWFDDGTEWDITGVSRHGPAPGFLVGGANPTYDWDGCCPGGCSGNVCDADLRNQIRSQPDQKAYYDFNTSWPMNSWSLSENSGGYQMAYIRLLSKFVDAEGVATSACGDIVEDPLSTDDDQEELLLFPNPSPDFLHTTSLVPIEVTLYTVSGKQVLKGKLVKDEPLDISQVKPGMYVVRIFRLGQQSEEKIIIE